MSRSLDLEKTVEADSEYKEYVKKERLKQKIEQLQLKDNQIEQDLRDVEESVQEYKQQRMDELEADVYEPENPQLSEKTEGLVKRVESNSDSHIVVFETKDGSVFKQDLSLGLPEDKGEWERLCEYVGVSPLPSELQGKIIPIIVPKRKNEPWLHIKYPRVFDRITGKYFEYKFEGYDTVKIDIPPVQKRLNPIVYKFRRVIMQRIRHSTWFENVLTKTALRGPLVFTPLIVTVLFLMYPLSESWLGVLNLLVLVSTIIYGVCAYCRLLGRITLKTGLLCHEKYRSISNYLFPSK